MREEKASISEKALT
jgi:hypothetical protein